MWQWVACTGSVYYSFGRRQGWNIENFTTMYGTSFESFSKRSIRSIQDSRFLGTTPTGDLEFCDHSGSEHPFQQPGQGFTRWQQPTRLLFRVTVCLMFSALGDTLSGHDVGGDVIAECQEAGWLQVQPISRLSNSERDVCPVTLTATMAVERCPLLKLSKVPEGAVQQLFFTLLHLLFECRSHGHATSSHTAEIPSSSPSSHQCWSRRVCAIDFLWKDSHPHDLASKAPIHQLLCQTTLKATVQQLSLVRPSLLGGQDFAVDNGHEPSSSLLDVPDMGLFKSYNVFETLVLHARVWFAGTLQELCLVVVFHMFPLPTTQQTRFFETCCSKSSHRSARKRRWRCGTQAGHRDGMSVRYFVTDDSPTSFLVSKNTDS